jgi:hypothetical protein
MKTKRKKNGQVKAIKKRFEQKCIELCTKAKQLELEQIRRSALVTPVGAPILGSIVADLYR